MTNTCRYCGAPVLWVRVDRPVKCSPEELKDGERPSPPGWIKLDPEPDAAADVMVVRRHGELRARYLVDMRDRPETRERLLKDKAATKIEDRPEGAVTHRVHRETCAKEKN